MFVLAINHFQKCFFINAGVWLCMENGFSEKEFQLTVKLRPLTWKIFSAKILPSNNFRRHAKRERERERTHTRKHRERERERERETQIANPENPRSSHHRQDHQTRDRWTQKTQDRCTASCTEPIAPASRTVTDLILVLDPKLVGVADLVVSISSHQWSRRRLSFLEVLDHSFFLPLLVWPNLYEECGNFEQISVSLKCIYWNFCNKICLWFWFFTFSLWSLIFLLRWWWCGWWCFGGFPVVWWWVLCGWWWKIAFS